jgi:hypothetical protein
VLKFEFYDTYDYLIINLESFKNYDDTRLKILRELLSKGCITSYDLTKFPVISELLPSFWGNDESFIHGLNSNESFKWFV